MSRLQEWHHDNHGNIQNWRYQSIFSWGESAVGVWTVKVTPQAQSDAKSLWVGFHLLVHTHVRDAARGMPVNFQFAAISNATTF